MQTIIITKEHYFPVFDKKPPLLVGDRAVRNGNDLYKVYDRKTGEFKIEIPADLAVKSGTPEGEDGKTLMQLIGGIIRAAREMRGIEQLELATKLRVSKQYINRLETGKCFPSIPQLKKISDLLDCELKITIKRKYGTSKAE